MKTPNSADDYRKMAARRLPKMVFDYLEGGCESERGLTANVDAFAAWNFLPRRLVDVSDRTLQTKLWAATHAMPVYVSPTGLNSILSPNGDAKLARAAARAGIPFALSTASNMTIEEIADLSDGEKWFQLYVFQRDTARIFTDRALQAGYNALILTVDVPVNGYRERDMRNGFGMPFKYTPKVMLDGALHPVWSFDFLRNGSPTLRNFESLGQLSAEAQSSLLRREMDASFDWDGLRELRDRWPKRLIVKGVIRPEDVLRCEDMGIDAVILSNHGARQLDDVPPPVQMLEEVVPAVKIPVFIDSGVRRGGDVIKSLCLGAGMVGLGRAVLYALAADGERGVERMLMILKDEMDRIQALSGAPTIEMLERSLLTNTVSTGR